MKSVWLGTLLMLSGSPAWAADLGSEITTWGPLATGDAPIQDGQWFAHVVGLGTSGDRLDGLFVVQRDPGVDIEVAGGFAYDRARVGNLLNASYDWGRAYVRGGTDPLADDAGKPFAAVGGALCLPLFLSVQADVGYSSQRKLIASGEASLFILRVRLEHDAEIDTVRIGTGPRILGTTGPWAWGALVDWTRSELDDDGRRLSAEGCIVSGFTMWRPWNHLLIAVETQFASGAMERDQTTDGGKVVAEVAFAVGTVF